MTVSNGQLVNAQVVNAAFISRTQDSDTVAKVGLKNIDSESGSNILNTQKAINNTMDAVGMTGEGDTTRKNYSSNNVVANGDSHKIAIGKLDAKFNNSTGHKHTGLSGDAPKINASDLDNINLFFSEYQDFSIVSASGSSIDISSLMTGKNPNGGSSLEGVLTTNPNNKVHIINSNTNTIIKDSNGQKVYGRITESSSVWTLSFFTNESGVETAHSLSSNDITVIYKEIFSQSSRPTIQPNALNYLSLDPTSDIVDATPTQRGLISTTTQSIAGNKTFQGQTTISDTTESTSKDTGALIVEGGVGIEKNLYVGGNTVIQGDLTVQGTTTTLNTSTLDVEDVNITVNKNGDNVSSEGAGLTVDRTGTKGSLIYQNSLASKFKAGDLGSESEILTSTHTQNVQNKTFDNTNSLTIKDSNFTIQDNSDTTKQAQFDLSGLTTATTRIFNLPDASTELLGKDNVAVITNKDIDGGTASNTNRITLPKDTKANLLLLTRKEGTLLYAIDEDIVYYDDGTNLLAVGSGAGGGATTFSITQAAHGFAVGNGIYHNGTQWTKALANDSTTVSTCCVVEVIDANNFKAANFGRIQANSHGFTVGEYYFLSPSVAGSAVNVEPSAPNFSCPLFFVESANFIQVLCYRPARNDLESFMASNKYAGISTASQTVINLPFYVNQSAKNNFDLFIDGKILREGAGNDYTFTSVTNNNSNQITLAVAISAGLVIQGIYRGIYESTVNLTPSKAVVSDSVGGLTTSTTSSTEIGYVAGVTSAIQTQINNIIAKLTPVGTVIDYAGTTEPTGWLFAAGQDLSRTTYSTLFAVIGTTYGAADGLTFKLPDLRGRVVAGRDNMNGTTANRLTAGGSGITGTSLNASGGTETHTLTFAQSGVPAHQHGLASHTHSGSSSSVNLDHVHSQNVAANGTAGVGFRQDYISDNANSSSYPQGISTGSMNTNQNHSHTITIGGPSTPNTDNNTAANAASAHQNTQPTLILNKIIKYV